MLSKVKQIAIQPIVEYLKENAVGKENEVKNIELKCYISDWYNSSLEDTDVRRIINLIRLNRLIKGLLAGKKGYYISTKVEEVDAYVTSLKKRIMKLQQLAGSFEKGYDEILNPKQISENKDVDADF